jgi:preprotein translocase subunit SecY
VSLNFFGFFFTKIKRNFHSIDVAQPRDIVQSNKDKGKYNKGKQTETIIKDDSWTVSFFSSFFIIIITIIMLFLAFQPVPSVPADWQWSTF